jgi:hypothetical protein
MGLGKLTREAGVCKKSSHATVKSIAKPKDYPYEEVHVLLLQWKKCDNLGNTKHGHTNQVRELMRVLVESIHVTTCLWKGIPSTDSFRYLQKLLHDFKSRNRQSKTFPPTCLILCTLISYSSLSRISKTAGSSPGLSIAL